MGVARFAVDRTYRRLAGGTVILGGSPLRLFRLSPAGQSVAATIEAGGQLPAGSESLTDRLVDAGAIHPRPAGGTLTTADVTVVSPLYGGPPLAAHAQPTIWVDDASPRPVPAAPGVQLIRRAVNGGPGAARNTGLAAVGTPLVAFVDADVQVTDGWLEPLVAHFDDPRVALVAPRVASLPGDSLVARYERSASPLDLGPLPAPISAGTRVGYVPGAAIVCRVDTLLTIGGFAEALRTGEDVDLVWRLVAAGHRCRYEPAAVVHHVPRPTLPAMLRQRAAYGASAGALARRHPGAVAPLRASRWSLAVCAALLARRPVLAGVLAGGTAVALQRKLRGVPAAVAWRLTLTGHAGAGAALATATRRVWWPLAVPAAAVFARARVPLAAAVAAAWMSPRAGGGDLGRLRAGALAVADDLAYGAGVWRGVLAERCVDPLLPGYGAAR